MANITVIQKRQLSELLAEGHRKFGRVKPRRKYRDEDDKGGAGQAELVFESHPLLAELPVGASSDLTTIISDYQDAMDEADKRGNEASNELKNSLVQVLGKQKTYAASPKPIYG